MRTTRRIRRGAPLALMCSMAASACVMESGHEGSETGEASAPLDLVIPGPSATFASSDGHLVHMEACGADPDCATDVPMTGNASPLFAEVDTAVRRFMKAHCIGSGVVAISYKGRRVYKRGFGRMEGSAMETLPPHCAGDSFNSNDFVLPDTDVNVGSVSKFVTGSMVRDLVKQRIIERGLEATYPDPTMARLLDPDLELLPPALLRYFDQTRPDAECPPVAVTDVTGCTRAGACGASGPDVRWQNVTIGDLIAHTAALPTSAPSIEDTIENAAVLRGHDSAGDFQLEHASVRAHTAYKTELDAARQYLADQAGADVGDVFFVNPWNRFSSDSPVNEVLTMVAGRCLLDDRNPEGQSDTNPADKSNYKYSNTGYGFLESVVTHLHPAGRFAAFDGAPSTHEGSALEDFLNQHGLESGVQNEHAIFSRHQLEGEYGGPARRQWSSSQATYRPLVTSWLRPFCVWNGASCSFNLWTNTAVFNDIYRLPGDFETPHVTYNPFSGEIASTGPVPRVPIELEHLAPVPGTGKLAIEAPALLALMKDYYVGVNNDVRLGRERATCGATCNVTGKKGGDAGGTRARAMTLTGGAKNGTLPPLTASGELSMEPDFTQWANVAWTDADDVDFVVSINQDWDEQQGGDGYNVEEFIRHALSRVDWAAVDRMLKRQRMNVVGVGISGAGKTFYWFEDDQKISMNGVPNTHDLEPAPVSVALPLPEAGAPGGEAPPSPSHYELPSTRIGSDVVGMAITHYDRVYAWYDDGHRSAGRSWDLADDIEAETYTVPSGYSFNDIVDVGITSGSTVATWFADGKMGFGTSRNLASGTLYDYTVPPGQTIEQIAGIAISKVNDHVFTVFKDGSVAEGTYDDLDEFSYRPGDVVGMGMKQGDTSIWYKSGYRKDLAGTPADNRFTADVLPSSDYYRLPSGYAYHEVAGIGQPTAMNPTAWFKNGTRAQANDNGDFISLSGGGATVWPVGNDGNTAVGVGIAGDGVVYSWYNTGNRAKGTMNHLASTATYPSYQLPAGQQELLIDGMAIDSGGDGFVWTLFRDGAIARGRSWDLSSASYWYSPHINPIP